MAMNKTVPAAAVVPQPGTIVPVADAPRARIAPVTPTAPPPEQAAAPAAVPVEQNPELTFTRDTPMSPLDVKTLLRQGKLSKQQVNDWNQAYVSSHPGEVQFWDPSQQSTEAYNQYARQHPGEVNKLAAYEQGFMDKCAQLNIDPKAVLQGMAANYATDKTRKVLRLLQELGIADGGRTQAATIR
jgi:hypothetical protein